MTAVTSDFPGARLCHTIERHVTASSLMAYPIEIRRPERAGSVERTVTCGFCGDEVTLIVYGAARTSALRRRWLTLASLGGVLATLGVLGMVHPMGDISAGSPLLGALVLVTGTGVVLALSFLRLWFHEDGVRHPAPDRWEAPRHSVRLSRGLNR